MEYLSFNNLKTIPKKKFGAYLFLIGSFLLPSTMVFGILFLICASVIGSTLQKKSYFRDKWNYPFFIFGILILLSSILHNFFLKNIFDSIWDTKLSFIGLGNWLPFIWFFWAVQPFLVSKTQRRAFSLVLIAGTFPVLITGFGQYFFSWTGPFETLNGLIIWYQRPINNPGGLSGLFSNQNYAGSWLNFAWPFCLALFLEKGKNIFIKISKYGFLFSTGLAAFLTFSRNAWIGLFSSFPIVTGRKGINFILPIFFILLFFLFFLLSPLFTSELQNDLKNLFPEKILMEFSEEGYTGLDVSRITIFIHAIEIIKQNPIFGTGAASFSEIFLLKTDFWKGHSHNLILELSVSYGLPCAILFFTTISRILIISNRKIFFSKKELDIPFFDRAFWAALFTFLITQLSDIQYFDGKISMVAWILIAGLKNIIEESDISNYQV